MKETAHGGALGARTQGSIAPLCSSGANTPSGTEGLSAQQCRSDLGREAPAAPEFPVGVLNGSHSPWNSHESRTILDV